MVDIRTFVTDPVRSLPPEIMECVWQYLEISDLLNSLHVSTSWNHYLKLDPIWRKYCKNTSTKITPWRQFLQERKLDYYWKKGIFQEYAMQASFEQICLSKTKIYLAEDNQLTYFTPTLKIIGTKIFPDKIKRICPFGIYCCVIFKKSEANYEIKILQDMNDVITLNSTSDKVVTTDIELCFRNGFYLHLWKISSEKTQLFHLPWEISDFYIYNNRVIVKRRCGYGYILSISSVNDTNKWEDIFNSSNRSPLGYSTVYIKSDPKGVAILDIFESDEYFCYSDLIIYGKNISYKMGSSKIQYFECCFTDTSILFTDSWGHLINLNLINGNVFKTKLSSPIDTILSYGDNFILTYRNHWEFWSDNLKRYCVKKGFPSTVFGVGNNYVFAMSGRTINVWSFGEKT